MKKSRPIDRIAANSQVMDSGCINWLGKVSNAGYGRIGVNNKKVSIHRVVATFYHGEPTKDQHALHSCDNRICVNPEHLRWGTQQENMNDRSLRNRQARHFGEKNPMAKLTAKDVIEIRALRAQKVPMKAIEEAYGITRKAIYLIVTRQRWGHLN